jgi:selenocysteine lyase/cysteine desulfurase
MATLDKRSQFLETNHKILVLSIFTANRLRVSLHYLSATDDNDDLIAVLKKL